MVADYADLERQQKSTKMTRPQIKLHYDPQIAFRGYLQYERSQFQRVPDPEEIADVDPHWLADLNAIGELLKFYRDYDKVESLLSM